MGRAKHVKKKNVPDILSHLYYNPSGRSSLGGLKRLRKGAKEKYSVQESAVKSWLSSQDTYTLHRKALKKFKRRKIVASGMEDQLQADLIDMSKFKQVNDGYSFILSIIDVFSKKAWAIPLRSKSGIEVSEVFSKFLARQSCRVLQIDKGREFLNKHVKEILQKHGVEWFTTENEDIKAAVVERWNQTIQGKIYRWFTKSGDKRWIDILPKFTNSYNETPHGATKIAPNDVNYTNEEMVWNRLYHTALNKPHKIIFHVGDAVRIAKHRTIFAKGYTAKWSAEIFTVTNILNTDPPTYRIEDNNGNVILGAFYAEELQKINVTDRFLVEKILRQRKNGVQTEYLVKWKGYSAKYNSWIKDNDLSNIFP